MRKRLDNNAILSITATIVSVCALFVAVYQTILMRQQQDAAVWPKLVFYNAYFEKGDFYRLDIRNVGIGPAIIKDVKINYQGKSFKDLEEYGHYLIKMGIDTDSVAFDHSDLLPEYVIPQDETQNLVDVKQNTKAASLFIAGIKQFTMTVTYESIFGKQWQVQYPYRKKTND